MGVKNSGVGKAVPVVSNVRASTLLVDILYDVADSDGDALTVSVMVKTGGVAIAARILSVEREEYV